MNPTLKNIIAFVLAWIGGSAVNMGLIEVGSSILPIEGIEPGDMDALAAIMPTLGYEYFIFPFLAHALGTLTGAAIVVRLAASHQMKLAYGIGGFFLLGGLMMIYLLPGPIWFAALDIAIAYIPMAWIGGSLGGKVTGQGS